MCGLTCFRQVGTELVHIRSSNIQEPNRVIEVVLRYSLMLKYSQFSFHRPASTDRRSRLDHALQVTIFLCSPKFRRIWMVPMVTYRDHLGSELFDPLLIAVFLQEVKHIDERAGRGRLVAVHLRPHKNARRAFAPLDLINLAIGEAAADLFDFEARILKLFEIILQILVTGVRGRDV